MNATATVPGKVMLAGEYAVLDGGRAVAVALDGQLQVDCRVCHEGAPAQTTRISLASSLWPEVLTFHFPGELPAGSQTKPFVDAAIAALEFFGQKPAAIEFSARGNLEPAMGAGSSSALRLATLAAAATTAARAANNAETPLDLDAIETLAVDLQRRTQPAASGYDVAIQRRGGGITFCKGKSFALGKDVVGRLEAAVELMSGGAGAPTGSTMKDFLAWLTPARKVDLLALSESQVDAWLRFMEGVTSVSDLIAAVAAHRKFMAGSPVYPQRIAQILDQEPGVDEAWTWKPTGAGGEDSILLIGPPHATYDPRNQLMAAGWQRTTMRFTQEGLRLC